MENTNVPDNVSLLEGEKIRAHELAKALGVPQVTVHRWEKRGILPAAMRIGKAVMWPKADIEKFLEESRGQ